MNHRPMWTSLCLGVLLSTSSAVAAEPTKQQCIGANESAQDLRRAGKLREARASLAVCTAASCPGAVREDCAQRLTEIEAAMPTLVFAAKDGAGRDLSAVRVTMDSAPLVDRLDGTAIAVDPGEHRFSFEADGLRGTEKTLVVREGDKSRRVLIVLQSTSLPLIVQPESRSSDGSTQRSLGLALAASGAAALVVGGIFGVVSKATYDHAIQTECGGDSSHCTPQGVQDGQTARGQAIVSTILFVGAGALLAGGGVMYFTARKPRAGMLIGPTVANRGGGVALSGTW
jgi:hypothetical protein